ncbi:MAG: HNH endonuclease [Bacteroidota bacterium]
MGAFAIDLNEGTFSQDTDSYKNRLMDPRWKARKEEILKRDDHRCVVCGSTEELEVHHRQYHYMVGASRYRDPWDYNDSLLITLCKKCHSNGHKHYKIPVIFMDKNNKIL